VPQTYRPPEVEGRVYYQPSAHGFEEEIAERMRHTDAEPDAEPDPGADKE
jgi:replication-associated recombination protein RarA